MGRRRYRSVTVTLHLRYRRRAQRYPASPPLYANRLNFQPVADQVRAVAMAGTQRKFSLGADPHYQGHSQYIALIDLRQYLIYIRNTDGSSGILNATSQQKQRGTPRVKYLVLCGAPLWREDGVRRQKGDRNDQSNGLLVCTLE